VRTQALRTAQHLLRIGEQSAAGVVQLRRTLAAVEQRDAKRRFERLNRLADRRLDTPKPPRGRGKTSLLSYRDEYAKLVSVSRSSMAIHQVN
jgi:hypothetical protein